LKYINITRIKLKINLIKKIKVIRSNKSEEYKATFGEFCFWNDIIHQTTTYLFQQIAL
jgi:hypothetical protein